MRIFEMKGLQPIQDGRIFIEVINWPFLSEPKGTPGRIQGWP
jgi:hypothetical protein